MDLGWHDLCLKTADLEASRRFYEALGFEAVHEDERWVSLTNGNLKLSLMTFLEGNLLAFRGADVPAVYRTLQQRGLDLPGAPRRYDQRTMGSDGVDWRISDPDGNPIYFDTMASEASLAARVEALLRGVERQLARMGIDSPAFEAFRDELTREHVEAPQD